jgi:hypothetical protein
MKQFLSVSLQHLQLIETLKQSVILQRATNCQLHTMNLRIVRY